MPTEISGSTGVNKIQSSAIEYGDLPTGSVLQVVESVLSSQSSTTSTSFVDAGLSASITPTSTSSKILVTASLGGAMIINNGGANAAGNYRILKDSSTEVVVSRITSYDYGGSGSYIVVPAYLCKLDSPSTTSTVTYTLQMHLTTGNDIRICRGDSTANLTLTEIAG